MGNALGANDPWMARCSASCVLCAHPFFWGAGLIIILLPSTRRLVLATFTQGQDAVGLGIRIKGLGQPSLITWRILSCGMSQPVAQLLPPWAKRAAVIRIMVAKGLPPAGRCCSCYMGTLCTSEGGTC